MNLCIALIPIFIVSILNILQLLFTDNIISSVSVLCGIISVFFIALHLKINLDEIEKGLYIYLEKGLSAISIILMVGIMIGVWILSGVIPMMVYHGLSIMSIEYFFISSTVLCMMTSLVTGTSWGTIGTIGTVILALANINNLSIPMTCGAIVSGAYFGDKMSPLSDTTNLSAAICNVNLFKHIGNMLPTTAIASIISLIIYLIMDLYKVSPQNVPNDQIRDLIKESFHISYILLIPPL